MEQNAKFAREFAYEINISRQLHASAMNGEQGKTASSSVTKINLFQQVSQLRPTLPQYHPMQLLGLLEYGKVSPFYVHTITNIESKNDIKIKLFDLIISVGVI
jgi:hypothetical protein